MAKELKHHSCVPGAPSPTEILLGVYEPQEVGFIGFYEVMERALFTAQHRFGAYYPKDREALYELKPGVEELLLLSKNRALKTERMVGWRVASEDEKVELIRSKAKAAQRALDRELLYVNHLLAEELSPSMRRVGALVVRNVREMDEFSRNQRRG